MHHEIAQKPVRRWAVRRQAPSAHRADRRTSAPHHPRPTATPCVALAVLMIALFLLSAALGTSVATAAPTTVSTIQLQGETKTQVESLQTQAAAVQSEIAALDDNLEQLSESYNEVALRLEQTNQDLAAMRRRFQDTQGTYNYRQAKLEDRLVASYKAGSNSFLEILMATDDFTSFVKRLILLYHVTTQDQRLVEDVASALTDLSMLEAGVEAKKSEELRLREELEQKRAAIETTLAERQSTLDGLDGNIAQLVEQERLRQEAERQRLEAELRSKLSGWQMYAGPLPQTGDDVLNQFVQTAATYLGIPYVWAGARPSTGMDCSGYTSYVFAQHGIVLPHYSGYQAQMGVEVAVADIKAGDLLAFGSPVHHVGIYIGEGQYIHSPHTGEVIQISTLSDRSDLNTIRRFPIQARSGSPAVD
jgi:cell wall-associated NlpC family hydrolase